MDDAARIAAWIADLETRRPDGGMARPSDATRWHTERTGAIVVPDGARSAEERAIAECLEARGYSVVYGVSAARLYMYFYPRRGGGDAAPPAAPPAVPA